MKKCCDGSRDDCLYEFWRSQSEELSEWLSEHAKTGISKRDFLVKKEMLLTNTELARQQCLKNQGKDPFER